MQARARDIGIPKQIDERLSHLLWRPYLAEKGRRSKKLLRCPPRLRCRTPNLCLRCTGMYDIDPERRQVECQSASQPVQAGCVGSSGGPALDGLLAEPATTEDETRGVVWFKEARGKFGEQCRHDNRQLGLTQKIRAVDSCNGQYSSLARRYDDVVEPRVDRGLGEESLQRLLDVGLGEVDGKPADVRVAD